MHAAGGALPAVERKHNMALGKGISGPAFDCDNVWTFVFWQHFLDIAHGKVKLPIITVDTAKYLGCMPVALLAQTRAGEALWKWEVWHEQQLKYMP